MKQSKLIILASLGLLASVNSQADFQSLTCNNEYQGVTQLSLTNCMNGTYNLNITRPGKSAPETFASGLVCKNLDHSGAGTMVSLIHCTGTGAQGSGVRVVVGHSANVNWVDEDAQGNLINDATGAEVEIVLSKPGQDFPFQILTFSPDHCKQVN